MDGFEVARRFRNNPLFQNTMLVAMTGYGQDDDRLRSELAGFDHHSLKPRAAAAETTAEQPAIAELVHWATRQVANDGRAAVSKRVVSNA
jgi:CheY-like chemotaxis protein